MNILLWILFGAIAGCIASIVMGRYARMGALANIIVGILGALIGAFIMNAFGTQGVAGFNLSSMLLAIFGSVILLFVTGLFRRAEPSAGAENERLNGTWDFAYTVQPDTGENHDYQANPPQKARCSRQSGQYF